MVVFANLECNRVRVQEVVAAANGFARAINRLINHRPRLENFIPAQRQN